MSEGKTDRYKALVVLVVRMKDGQVVHVHVGDMGVKVRMDRCKVMWW